MDAIQGAVSFLLLVALVAHVYEVHRVDKLRQDLFEIRDALFDAAVAGRISFDSPAYEAARSSLNGMIRFAHQISVVEFLAMRLLVPRAEAEAAYQSFDSLISSGAHGDRRLVNKFLGRAHVRVVKYMLFSPLFLSTLLLPITFFLLLTFGVNLAKVGAQRLARQLLALDAVAYSEASHRYPVCPATESSC